MLDIAALRKQFPALQRRPNGRTPLFLDGPGGTQVPQRVLDAITHYLTTCNANHGGVFTTSRESDAILHDAHQAVADFLNAPSADEIVFGQNMTSLTFHISRSLAKTWKAGDEIVVTRLDHDANVSPWVFAARDAGATVKIVDLCPDDCTLDRDDLRRQLSSRTKLVAVTCASNAVGTLNDVKLLGRLAHDAGALIYLDAVHYAPHGPIDVQDWDCDFLACSAYKFFGPHVGILWGRRSLLESLSPYKVRPAPETTPDRWMTGTQNHEGLAGVAASVDYLASLQPGLASEKRRSRLRANLSAIREYETTLSRRLLQGLTAQPRFRVWGINDLRRLHARVPTVSITCRDRTPLQMAQHLADREIYAWNGNFYASNLTERLGLEEHGGLLRLGFAHYNTADEVDRLLQALTDL
jgi:cysteine desulfurase family protein (TIGR01976 family)